MIVAVEGPSAAGKTTWCRGSGLAFVAEYAPTGVEPEGADLVGQAAYWVGVNSQRWAKALELSGTTGVAVCDSDPLKLHYSWCLAAVGAAPFSRFEHELAAVRSAFARRQLGLPDVVLLSIPDAPRLMAQRLGDPTRRRRHFDLHARLSEPLAEWYAALERLDSGRVIDGFPPALDLETLAPPRRDRYDLDLLDSLVDGLPTV
ncbi:hypothetical protein BOX37_19275 [Nocardia mangyaensis]|uniref:Thymidylate kinase n=1 Tax=Nocardia mangyaensis TaxID=2213200 RepID=A0A1J0VUL4_9NOCA|nr:hypothetical protein [Nocardia mangyaensis]APE35733.1 hypothetical protein BOX37_19275 [Nocardia mangyaensis]